MTFEMLGAVELRITVTTLKVSAVQCHLRHLKAFCCHLVNVHELGKEKPLLRGKLIWHMHNRGKIMI
jgi:hypothetical protein